MSAVTTLRRAVSAPGRERSRGQATPGPRLRVVPDAAHHPLLWTVVTVLVLAAAVFGAVTLSALAADGTVEATRLEEDLHEAEATYSELLAEVAALEDPARIARVAEELGLVRAPRPRQLVVERLLPSDGAGRERRFEAGETTDRLKPLLAQDG